MCFGKDLIRDSVWQGSAVFCYLLIYCSFLFLFFPFLVNEYPRFFASCFGKWENNSFQMFNSSVHAAFCPYEIKGDRLKASS